MLRNFRKFNQLSKLARPFPKPHSIHASVPLRFPQHQPLSLTVPHSFANSHSIRQFSNKNQKPPKKDDEYSSAFDDLINEGSVSKEEKAKFEQRKQDKINADKKAAEDVERMRVQSDKQKEQAFDDFISGKEPDKKPLITDDMNLQDIFKTFYSKAKEVDVKSKNPINSALNSLNSFSSRLDARRKAAAEAKKKADAEKQG